MNNRVAIISLALAATQIVTGTAYGQTDPRQLPVPSFETTDPLGVDLNSGRFNIDSDAISLGAISPTPIAYHNILEIPRLSFEGIFYRTGYFGSPDARIDEYRLDLGKGSFIFRSERSGPFVSITPFSGTLTGSFSTGGLTYTDNDGSRYALGNNTFAGIALLSSIEKRSGEIIRYFYNSKSAKPVRVISNRGWAINGTGNSAVLYNRAQDFCPESAEDCDLRQSWPSIAIGGDGVSSRTFQSTGHGLISVTFSSATSAINFLDGRSTISVTYGAGQGAQAGRVSVLTNGSVSRAYTYSYVENPVFDTSYIDITSTASDDTTISGRSCGGTLFYLNYPLNRRYEYNGRSGSGGCYSGNWNSQLSYPSAIKMPEGNSRSVSYDNWRPSRVTEVSKNGSTITRTAAYLNQFGGPTSVADSKGVTSTFTYDSSGNLLSEVSPTDVNGVSQAKKYSYTQRFAWYRDSSFALVREAMPIWVISTETSCKSSALDIVTGNCAAGPTDQMISRYEYGPDGGPNSLMVLGSTSTVDNVTLRSCYAYDRFGNKTSETKPRAGLGKCS